MGSPNPKPNPRPSFWDDTIKIFAIMILIVAFLFACGVLQIPIP